MRVVVAVTTLWVAPDRPRAVDAAAVDDEPDVLAWLAALDRHREDGESGAGRLGLHGRVHTQLMAGEPVLVLDPSDGSPASGPFEGSKASEAEPVIPPGWVRVVCPWQPTSRDSRGYPGWLRRAHLIPDDTGRHTDPPEDESWAVRLGPDRRADLALAREHLGLPYLWGGMSPFGLDCSGLVHLVHRELGRVVPRDAHDQQAACEPVPVDEADPGDLYFFARPGEPAHHVGIAVRGGMIHAAGARQVVEEPLEVGPQGVPTAAGRLLP
jgi:gamma-D-glutamyl-L-lysine dipeptidyl-peptidase